MSLIDGLLWERVQNELCPHPVDTDGPASPDQG